MERAVEERRFKSLYESLVQDDGQLMYVGRLLQRTAEKHPERTAVICEDRSMTYHELYYRAVMMSKKLQERGVKQGDRVVLLYENSIEFFIAYFGAWQCGAVVAALNIFLHEQEVAGILEEAAPSAIIVSDTLKNKLGEAERRNGLVVVTSADIPMDGDVPVQIPALTVPRIGENEMAALLYTSGTTGTPKGVMLSSKNILTNVIQGLARMEVGPDDRAFGVLPFFHSLVQSSCIWGAVFLGSSTIIVPKIDRRSILRGLAHKPTVLLGVPAFYGLLCLMKTAPINDVRYFVVGGDAVSDKIRAAFALLYRRKLCVGYGLTETSPVITLELDGYAQPTNVVGRPLVHETIELRAADGSVVSNGKVGTIWVRGDNVMLGYYNAPEQTAKILQNGWLNTGDLGYLNEEGKLVITGREKDLIIHKGLNIYPQEIENVLLSHPAVYQAAVIGQEDSAGQIPVAYVGVKTPTDTLAQELEKLCKERLAAYKVPRSFTVMKELPMTATGKVDKKALKNK